MRIDVAVLAQILFEEFDRDDWGDIDPDLFAMAAVPSDSEDADEDDEEDEEDEEDAEEVAGMRAVLARVCARLVHEGEEE